MTNILDFCSELEADIKRTYEEGVTLDRAERLAAKFLSAQITIANELVNIDLDCRMKKSAVKALRAAVYMEAATKGDKKPSDTMLNSMVDMNQLVQGEQKVFDESDSLREHLQTYFSIFKEAHIYFRGVSKGRFE